jgi:hypothetical protein
MKAHHRTHDTTPTTHEDRGGGVVGTLDGGLLFRPLALRLLLRLDHGNGGRGRSSRLGGLLLSGLHGPPQFPLEHVQVLVAF